LRKGKRGWGNEKEILMAIGRSPEFCKEINQYSSGESQV
jgi:hypothetical protein